MQTPSQFVNDILGSAANQLDSKHLYHMGTNLDLNEMDESGIQIIILKGNTHLFQNEEETEPEAYYAAEEQFREYLAQAFSHPDYTKVPTVDGTHHWVSPCSDYVHIQSSDHCIYITLFSSGQY